MVYCPRCGATMCWDEIKGIGWWGCQGGCWLSVKESQNASMQDIKNAYQKQKREVD